MHIFGEVPSMLLFAGLVITITAHALIMKTDAV